MSKDMLTVQALIRNISFILRHQPTASEGDTVMFSYALRSEDKTSLPDRITVSFEINMDSQIFTLRNSFTSLPVDSSFEIGPLNSSAKILTNIALHFRDQTVKHSLATVITVRKFRPASDSLTDVIDYVANRMKSKVPKNIRILNYALIICIFITGVFLIRSVAYFLSSDLSLSESFAGYAYFSLFFAILIFLARLYLSKKREESVSANDSVATNIKE